MVVQRRQWRRHRSDDGNDGGDGDGRVERLGLGDFRCSGIGTAGDDDVDALSGELDSARDDSWQQRLPLFH